MRRAPTGIAKLSLRHLKAVRCVSDCGSVSQAARYLNRSQTAVTLAIKNIEDRLDVRLFDRSPAGMRATACCELLVKRIALMQAEFDAAGKEYRRGFGKRPGAAVNPVFSMEISYKRLNALLALEETGSIGRAAARLGLSRTAIYKALHELEDILEVSLFERYARRLDPRHFCGILVRHIKLAFTHLRHALDEMRASEGDIGGNIAIGMLPYSRTVLSPRAIGRLLAEYPALRVQALEGTYAQLEPLLRNGDLDLIVGATRDSATDQAMASQYLFRDRLALIARADHALAGSRRLSGDDIRRLKWILPAQNTPSRGLFDQWLKRQNLQLPGNYIETSSLTTIRGLLLESDRVALLSKHQVYYEIKHGLLAVLPIDLKGTCRSIGITRRRDFYPTPAIRLLLRELKKVARELRQSDDFLN